MLRNILTLCAFSGLLVLAGCSSAKTVKSIEEIKGTWKVLKLQADSAEEQGREEFAIVLENGTWRAVVTKDDKTHHVDLAIDISQSPSVISLLKEGVTVAAFKITVPQDGQMKWETSDYHVLMERK